MYTPAELFPDLWWFYYHWDIATLVIG